MNMKGVGVRRRRLEGGMGWGVEGNLEVVAPSQQQTFFCGWKWYWGEILEGCVVRGFTLV